MCMFEQVRICPEGEYLAAPGEFDESIFLYSCENDETQTFYEISRVHVTFSPWEREDIHNACHFLMCELWEKNVSQREVYCSEPQAGLILRTKTDDSLCPGQFLLGCYVLVHPDTVLLVQTVGNCCTDENVQKSFENMLKALHCIYVDEKPISLDFDQAKTLSKEMQPALADMELEALVQKALQCESCAQPEFEAECAIDDSVKKIPADARNPASRNNYALTELYAIFASYFSTEDMIEITNKKFAFSGFRHKEMYYLADRIEAYGGIYQLNVSGNTDYVVCDCATNAKVALLQAIQQIDKRKKLKLIWRKDLEGVLDHLSGLQYSFCEMSKGTEDKAAEQLIDGPDSTAQEVTKLFDNRDFSEEYSVQEAQSLTTEQKLSTEINYTAAEERVSSAQIIPCSEQEEIPSPQEELVLPDLTDAEELLKPQEDQQETDFSEEVVEESVADRAAEVQEIREGPDADETELRTAADDSAAEPSKEENDVLKPEKAESFEMTAEDSDQMETQQTGLQNLQDQVISDSAKPLAAETEAAEHPAEIDDAEAADNHDELAEKSAEPTAQKETAKKEGCYIATAVYGSYDAPKVQVLRRFRDERLQKSCAGRWFIRTYYRVSPPIARRLKNAKVLNKLVRKCLDRFVDHLM